MNPKASAIIEKAGQDRRRSNFKKALSRLEDGTDKVPEELGLYTEAIDVSMETGEALKALHFFRKARRALPNDAFELWSFTVEKVGTYNDPIVGKFLLDYAINNEELSSAQAVLENLKDHTVDALLERIRTKKQTFSSAIGDGFAAREELLNIAVTEGLVCLRLNRFSEAADCLVHGLDDKPDLCRLLEPFLFELEKQHAEKGEVSFVLGCCHLAGAKYSKGFHELIRAAKTAPSLASSAITRIESLGEDPDISAVERTLRLAELYLGQGEDRRAVELMRSVLKQEPTRAAEIIEVLTPGGEDVGDELDCHFLSIDAALILGRAADAIAQIRKIYKIPKHKKDVFRWLEKKSKERGTSVEVLLFFGEAALSEKMAGKAIELFKEILSHGPQEETTIKELLSRHQSLPLARHYYNERFGAATARERASEFEFKTYESLDISSGEKTQGTDEASRPHGLSSASPADTTRDASFDIDDFSFGLGTTDGVTESPKGDGVFENHDFSLSMHDCGPDTGTRSGKSEFDTSDVEFKLSDDGAEPPCDDPEPAVEKFEAPGDDSIPADEGADFFEYLKRDFSADDPSIGENDPEDSMGGSEEDAFGLTEDEIVDLPADLPLDSEDPRADFDSLYQSFLAGDLDGSTILELVEEALTTCRWDEMKTLLTFEPGGLGEEIDRKYYLCEYYMAIGRPLPALIVLKTVHLDGLNKDERRSFMQRIAACYEAMFNFEAAHGVYLRIIAENPDQADIERMAASNYEKYLKKIAGAAPVLERVTTL